MARKAISGTSPSVVFLAMYTMVIGGVASFFGAIHRAKRSLKRVIFSVDSIVCRAMVGKKDFSERRWSEWSDLTLTSRMPSGKRSTVRVES